MSTPRQTPEPLDEKPVLSPELQTAVREELSPKAADQARLRDAIWSGIARGELSKTALRVDAQLSERAAVSGAKVASGTGAGGKLLVLGVLALGGAGLVTWLHSQQTGAPTLAAVSSRPVVTAAPPPLQAAVEPEAPPQPQAASAPAHGAPPLRVARAPRPRSRAVPAVTTPTPEPEEAAPTPPEPEPAAQHFELATELRLVQAASRALTQGHAAEALEQLRQHTAQYPSGALRVEADALRAVALCNLHAPEAGDARQRFLREHGSSPLAERVKRGCTAR